MERDFVLGVIKGYLAMALKYETLGMANENEISRDHFSNIRGVIWVMGCELGFTAEEMELGDEVLRGINEWVQERKKK